MSILLSTPKEKRRMEKTSLSDLYERSESYVAAAVNGSLVPNGVRATILKKAGIIEDKDYSVTVKAMIAQGMAARMLGNLSYSEVVRRLAENERAGEKTEGICPLSGNVVPKEALRPSSLTDTAPASLPTTSTNAASESCTSKLELTVDDILKTPKDLGRPEVKKGDSSAKCLRLTNEKVMQEELQSQPTTSGKSGSKTKKSKEDVWECDLCEVLYSTDVKKRMEPNGSNAHIA
ncbi:unnamed protein product [Parnassius apollo]|uniref:(apollo) hypothetical protein n=1 Tax=Parnassius apollo TaxID=110799 RepID=A0A8S3WG34_PARAO|nr:unnamed protein product [Parnassius apollo]